MQPTIPSDAASNPQNIVSTLTGGGDDDTPLKLSPRLLLTGKIGPVRLTLTSEIH